MIGRQELQRVAQPDHEPRVRIEAQDPGDRTGVVQMADRPFRQNPVGGLEIAKVGRLESAPDLVVGYACRLPQEEVRFLRL
jgi:hypothetical protein